MIKYSKKIIEKSLYDFKEDILNLVMGLSPFIIFHNMGDEESIRALYYRIWNGY